MPETPAFGRQTQDGPGVQGQSGQQGETLSWTANTKKERWLLVAEPKVRFTYLTWKPLGQGSSRRQKQLGCQKKLKEGLCPGRRLTQGVGHGGSKLGAAFRLPDAQLGYLCFLPSDCLSLASKMPKCRCRDGWVTDAGASAQWGLSSGTLEGQRSSGNRGGGKLPLGQDLDRHHASPQNLSVPWQLRGLSFWSRSGRIKDRISTLKNNFFFFFNDKNSTTLKMNVGNS